MNFELKYIAWYILHASFTAFIVHRVHALYVSNAQLEEFINDYYCHQGFFVQEIEKLNTTERIKYGVPTSDLFRIYNYYFGFFTGKIEYTRKVLLVDENGVEQMSYVELEIRKRKLHGFKEFDSYQF